MSATVIDETTQRVEAEEAARVPEEPVAKTGSAQAMFKFSDYLDVGEGAAECDHSRDGQCEDIGHFHAWCRLPNPYQHEDIRKKSLAAKARRIRELKDPESDASVVLDQELSSLADPIHVENLIDELLSRDWADDYQEAQRDIDEREEFEHIVQDREEFTRLDEIERDLPEDEQSDGYKQLISHLTKHVEEVRARLIEVQEPRREELRSRSVGGLVEILREARVAEQGDHAFLEAYDAWMWFVGTFKVAPNPTLKRPYQAMWDEIGHPDRPSAGTMFGEAPEVIHALKIVFTDLQLALQRGSSGN